MPARRLAVAAVWLLTAAGAVLADVLVPGTDAYAWLATTLVLAVVAGMIVQLLFAEQHGFVVRLAATSAGSFLVVSIGAIGALLR